MFFSPENHRNNSPATPEMFTRILLELNQASSGPRCKTKLAFSEKVDLPPPTL
jgi:hypothetical protein